MLFFLQSHKCYYALYQVILKRDLLYFVRFPLLQVFLFAKFVKTPHICRLGAQGKHCQVLKYTKVYVKTLSGKA